jgi:hypothetical protein
MRFLQEMWVGLRVPGEGACWLARPSLDRQVHRCCLLELRRTFAPLISGTFSATGCQGSCRAAGGATQAGLSCASSTSTATLWGAPSHPSGVSLAPFPPSGCWA